jgi:predicted anti-sigma-YlaC factor YlaD
VLDKKQIVELDCSQVWRQLVDYMEDDVTSELRRRIEAHLRSCRRCTAVYDGARNIVSLLGADALIELPEGFSRRLRERLAAGCDRHS